MRPWPAYLECFAPDMEEVSTFIDFINSFNIIEQQLHWKNNKNILKSLF